MTKKQVRVAKVARVESLRRMAQDTKMAPKPAPDGGFRFEKVLTEEDFKASGNGERFREGIHVPEMQDEIHKAW